MEQRYVPTYYLFHKHYSACIICRVVSYAQTLEALIFSSRNLTSIMAEQLHWFPHLLSLAGTAGQLFKSHQKHITPLPQSQVKTDANLSCIPPCVIINLLKHTHSHACTCSLPLQTLDRANRTLTVVFKPISEREYFFDLLTFRTPYYSQNKVYFFLTSLCGYAELNIRLCYL